MTFPPRVFSCKHLLHMYIARGKVVSGAGYGETHNASFTAQDYNMAYKPRKLATKHEASSVVFQMAFSSVFGPD